MTKIVPNHATNPSRSEGRLLNRHTNAMTTSTTPTTSSKWSNLMPAIGSTNARDLELPNPLKALAIPVVPNKTPALTAKQRCAVEPERILPCRQDTIFFSRSFAPPSQHRLVTT